MKKKKPRDQTNPTGNDVTAFNAHDAFLFCPSLTGLFDLYFLIEKPGY